MSPDRTVRALKLPKGSRSKRPTISQCVGVTPAYLLCCLPCPFPFTHLQAGLYDNERRTISNPHIASVQKWEAHVLHNMPSAAVPKRKSRRDVAH
ncbi:hypothetical protein K474DRAFT_738835 [Panus rudis PR-1116 ss-1]|nr:hypothetical protein K474DRAFT_738835 [Panus rudis PR-1116 ss-1]